MRWPFRRRGDGAEPGVAPPRAVAPAAGATAPVAVAAVRRSGRDWAGLAPLPLLSAAPPLTSGPAPVLPPLPGERYVPAQDVPAAVGQVEGLARLLPALTAVPPPREAARSAATPARAAQPVGAVPLTIEPAGQPPVAVPLLHRPVTARPDERASLVQAVDEYVGEPREPAERQPTWMRGGVPPS